jgi:hypothetical protein
VLAAAGVPYLIKEVFPDWEIALPEAFLDWQMVVFRGGAVLAPREDAADVDGIQRLRSSVKRAFIDQLLLENEKQLRVKEVGFSAVPLEAKKMCLVLEEMWRSLVDHNLQNVRDQPILEEE